MKLFGWHKDDQADWEFKLDFVTKADFLVFGIPVMTELWMADHSARKFYLYEKKLFGITVWRAK